MAKIQNPGETNAAQFGENTTSTVASPAMTEATLQEAARFAAYFAKYRAMSSAIGDNKVRTDGRLAKKWRLTVAFPPCASEILSLIKSDTTDEVARIFNEYFKFDRHVTLGMNGPKVEDDLRLELDAQLDEGLKSCEDEESLPDLNEKQVPRWPSECCLCEPCVTLDGIRNLPNGRNGTGIKRLFIGDVLWLFYFDRMGLNQILGAILDAYAYNGRIPISNGSLNLTIRDDMVALVLEMMVRQVKTGLSSAVRDRAVLYRQVLGWASDAGRKLNVDSEVNGGFNSLFHKFIHLALEFYRDRRLAQAIQGVETHFIGNVSKATVAAIRETIELLKKRFEPFHYGRNYYNALSGIVWSVATLSVVRELVNTLGIPNTMNEPHEFIPAAYDILVLKRPITSGEVNRFIVHRDCAVNGRDILLDMEVIDHGNEYELAQWVNDVESKVEGYRSAYLAMTGVDLGTKTPEPTIEQKA